jgi:hypothetical protein
MRDRTPEPGVTHWLDSHGEPANWSEEWDKELHRDMIERSTARNQALEEWKAARQRLNELVDAAQKAKARPRLARARHR